MTPQEIIEGEKLLLEFMGYKLSPCRNGMAWEAPEGDPFKLHGLLYSTLIGHGKFHYSWDWLMPVVKKCSESFEHHQYDSEEYYHITEEIFHPDYSLSEFMDADIEAVYSRVVTYIKWYNQNKEK